MSLAKKILFISVSAGMGHVRAAEALRLTAKEKYPEIISEHIDMADYSSAILKYPSTAGYAALVRHIPKVYGAIYRTSDSQLQSKIISKFNFLFKLNTRKLIKYIDNFAPDRIVCTHFLVPLALKKYYGRIPISLVVTDYTAHNFWRSPFVNNYYVANNSVKRSLNLLNVNIKATGLPIHPQFLIKKDKAELKLKLGIKNDWPIILLMAGGQGLIQIDDVVKEIINYTHKANVVAISGKSSASFHALKKIKTEQLIPLQFVNNIDEWMRIADVIVTKPGGMSVTECMHLKKPMILIDPIPGQEEANVHFIEENKYGQEVKDIKNLPKLLGKLLNNRHYFKIPHLPENPNEKILIS